MKHKKAVTEPVLIIGVLIIAATILLLGTTRVLVPLIKTQNEVRSIDFAAVINTAYAAPENISINYAPAVTKDNDKVSLNVYQKLSKACVSHDGVRCTPFTRDVATQGPNENFFVQKVTILKEYDAIAQKNKLSLK
ncbi:MAG: hypothetical protein AABX75_02010 [Nanoarchaeota archaeon]